MKSSTKFDQISFRFNVTFLGLRLGGPDLIDLAGGSVDQEDDIKTFSDMKESLRTDSNSESERSTLQIQSVRNYETVDFHKITFQNCQLFQCPGFVLVKISSQGWLQELLVTRKCSTWYYMFHEF